MTVSVLPYGCTSWRLLKFMEKKWDGNYTRMPHAVLNKSYKQHPTKQQLYSHLLTWFVRWQLKQTWHAGQIRINHGWHSLMDSYIWRCQCWLTSKDIHTSACPVHWGCWIHQLYLCRGVRPPPFHWVSWICH